MMPSAGSAARRQDEDDAHAASAARPPFQQEDGRALRFYVRPGPAKAQLAPLIRRGGGQLCRLQEPGAVLLARPGEVPPAAAGDFVCTRYVADCLARGAALPLERYRLRPGPAAGARVTAGRLPCSGPEDRAAPRPVRRLGRLCGGGGGGASAGAERRGPAPAPAARVDVSQTKQAMDVPQQEDPRHIAEGSKAPSIFQLANQEFESDEWESESPSPSGDTLLKHPEPETSEKASISTKVRVVELMSSEDSAAPQNQSLGEGQPGGPSSEQVASAMEDMKNFMAEFGVDLATVTQAFLKTSGQVAAAAHCLQSGPHSEDCPPLWTRQDDLDLLTGDDHLRSKLIAKYGEENVNRRMAFRKN